MTELEPPSKRTLLEATGIAAFVSLAVLGLFILPAEYGIDPTGFGEAIGIKDLGVPVTEGSVHTPEDAPFRTDAVSISLAPGQGLEYKFRMDAGSGFVYQWNATAALFFDFHGEPGGGSTFQSYEVDTRAVAHGSFQAPFAGTHGWYWKNSSDQVVTVTLETAGHYEIVGVV